jgi:hypothetical protein
MAEPLFEQVDVFGVEGRDVYRIPSLVVSNRGTILAFCNRRVGSAADHGHDAHLVLRRSFDDGRTWLPVQPLFDLPGWAAGDSDMIVLDDGAILCGFEVSETGFAREKVMLCRFNMDWLEQHMGSIDHD